MSRFNDAVLKVSSFDQAVGITAVIQCLNHERFRDNLIKHPLVTYDEVNVRSGYINGDLNCSLPISYLYEVPHSHGNNNTTGVKIPDNQPENETQAAPIEDVEEVHINDKDLNRKTQIGTHLNPKERAELIAFLRVNKDVFVWTSTNMPGIPAFVSMHKLSTNPLKKPVAQKQHLFEGERLKVIKDEVEKLLQVCFIRRVDYCEWVSNPMFVKKDNGKWLMCIDYTNLNQACPKDYPKDYYPMPKRQI
ncbi:hypothetical protein SLEP1_g18238 [Rubroshorea leprosula]|uniref:Uncharacterized protein n=1 Tax=Rubroshorea leprosula TaxID=152421 RepID=A0AAV5IWT9_9ROSI|nr:hypothetical protein SLEP1_g18238 [Rubroshorea leprosula]